jgi:hypothetical protein
MFVSPFDPDGHWPGVSDHDMTDKQVKKSQTRAEQLLILKTFEGWFGFLGLQSAFVV